ncbi:hypothetical protein SP15_075 [Bacillus phage SP-15]|uniref:Uncharacterized protein n=1 Tax=Bacillus phage SP-15 TaxID=1792032 RepID=A0A127AX75_9CAUD|nr:hypothetical protein SP15_075 [Bacillus phage SP-15]AMM44874.1 hypothetical protein SP15_075 [Bacillus phage SP-15]
MMHEDSYVRPYVIENGRMVYPIYQLPISDDQILSILKAEYFEKHGAVVSHSFKSNPDTEFGGSTIVSALFEDGFEIIEECWSDSYIRDYFNQFD